MSNVYNPLTGKPAGWPLSSLPPIIGETEIQQDSKSRTGIPAFNSIYGQYNSFTGADIVAYIHIPSQEALNNQAGGMPQTSAVVGVLGNIQTISYSTFREVNPVRSLGRVYADSYTRGPRTIAGTIIWTVLDQYVLAKALTYAGYDSIDGATSILADQIPPFSIVITMANEYGDVASMALYGVRIVNEGSTYSIDDMVTEQTNTFIAGDIDLLHKGSPFKNPASSPSMKSGTSILRAAQQSAIYNAGSM